MAINVTRKLKRLRAKERKRKQDEQERLFPFYKGLAELERLARQEAATRAAHYDGFNVGTAALVKLPNGTYRMISGTNKKKAPGPRQKDDHCSEHEVLRLADDLRCEIIGMYVAAPHRPDDNTEYDLGATISCWHCRIRYRKRLARGAAGGYEPLRGNTQIVFLNLDDDRRRPELSVDSLLGLCKKKDELRQPELICDIEL